MPSSFAITTAANSTPLDGSRHGQTVFTVSNASGRPMRGRARIVPDNPAATAWLTLTGGAERDFSINGTQQYIVQIAAPPTAPAGNYAVRLDMVGVDNPDEDFTQGPGVTFAVPAPLPAKKPFPWWIIAVIVVALIAVVVLITRSGQDSAAQQAAQATATAAALQQAASLANATAAARTTATAQALASANADATATAQAGAATSANATATAQSEAASQATATAVALAKPPTIAAKVTNGVVTIARVSIDGGGNVAEVAPGATFSIILDYTIVDPGCPGCIDQIQIGYSNANPDQCIYSGIPGAAGKSGTSTFKMIAPAAAGTYFIGFDRSQDFNCPTGWWSGAPDASRHLAAIVVK